MYVASADFESVVIVRNDYTGGLNGLRGATFCHPGLVYNKQQRWSERFLKHFERTIVPENCNQSKPMSPAELEVAAIADYFGPSCRPGLWSNNRQEDQELSTVSKQIRSDHFKYFEHFIFRKQVSIAMRTL